MFWLKREILILAVLMLAAGTLTAQPSASGTAVADIVQGLTLIETAQLQFGSLFAVNGGTVTVTPAGTRTFGGTTTGLPGGFTPATFAVGAGRSREPKVHLHFPRPYDHAHARERLGDDDCHRVRERRHTLSAV